VRSGDLAISQVVPSLVDPAYEMPQGTPNQPFKFSSYLVTGNPNPGSPPISPTSQVNGYFIFSICNVSKKHSDMVQSVSTRIASFTPHAGALAAWRSCADGTYNAQSRMADSGGCGDVMLAANEFMQAVFPETASVGDSVTAQVTSSWPTGQDDPNFYPGLPLLLAPGHSLSVAVALTAPTAPGAYTFAFSFAANSAAAVYFSTTKPILVAPITNEWSGQNCVATAMQAQIPAATQPIQYMCPAA
jgi:hypothetical protein